MLIKKQAFDYLNVLKYLSLTFVFLLFNYLEKDVYPYSFAPLVAGLSLGASPIVSAALFLCAFLLTGKMGLLGAAAIGAGINVIVFSIYKKLKILPKYEIILFAIASVLGYLILGDTSVQVAFDKRVFVSIAVVFLTVILTIAGKAVAEKGLKFKLSKEELACVAAALVVVGVCVCNLITPDVWKGFSVFLILLSCFLFKTGIATVVSATLGISLAIFYGDLNYVSVFLVWGLFAEGLTSISRYLAALAILVADYLLQFVFSIYTNYSLLSLLPVFCGVVVFCLIPTIPLQKLKEKLYSFREKQLSRQAINRNRLMLSNKLYELSGVFSEMSSAWTAFKKTALTEDKAKQIMENSIKSSVCEQCAHYKQCNASNVKVSQGLSKVIDIGFAKGKLSLIDFPKELSESCLHPNDIIYGLNRLLGEYRAYLLQNANVTEGRQLIADEASGIAEILRSLALESGALLKYQSRLERLLSNNLLKKGFPVSELLIYGERERLSVGMILASNEVALNHLQKVVSDTLSMPMDICDRVAITEDKFYLHLKRAVDFDAVFGLSKRTKDGSEISGDTHSVTRISEEKFLVALSDGMGSGKQAEAVASASLSLIESFYKAGLSGQLILSTVNKLLAINTEDSFTALDISVIDLKNSSADFIKYGSPYGFIINENGIKIVEGNSLPIGILDELKPAVCSTPLDDGDMILLVTDGISDAFGSSGDLIDYLRGAPAKNPQALTDGLLAKATELNGGKSKDDMTALAVRFFKKGA